jgi:phosphoglycolate phosphatase
LRAAFFGGNKPEALIFDLDGTLADSAPDIHRSLNAVLSRSGLPLLELRTVTLMIGGGPEVLVRRALGELGLAAESDEIKRLTASFQHTYLEQGNTLTTLFRGAVDCLDHLARQDIPIGLCSNKPEHICHQLLLDLDIRRFFDAIQGSGTGLPMKPHPAALLAILRRLGAAPERALYVGDSKTDVETARAAGVAVALVKCGYSAAPATTLGADWVVECLSEIPSIWQSL